MKKSGRKRSKKKSPSSNKPKGLLALLPKNRDLSLITLKGHLLIEEEINNQLEKQLKYPEALAGTKFDFQQRLSMLQAVICTPDNQRLEWALISKLNIIRNLLSYNLTDEEIEKLVNNFLEEFAKLDNTKPCAKTAKTDVKLKNTVACLCEFIKSL